MLSNTTTPSMQHVHVVIAGAGERFDTGNPEAVIIKPDDYTFLKERGREHSEFAHQQLIQETLREISLRDDTMTSHREFVLERGFER
jgi:hypothetical protein